MCSNISYMSINQDSAFRENTILIVNYCLIEISHELDAESSFVTEKRTGNLIS